MRRYKPSNSKISVDERGRVSFTEENNLYITNKQMPPAPPIAIPNAISLFLSDIV